MNRRKSVERKGKRTKSCDATHQNGQILIDLAPQMKRLSIKFRKLMDNMA